MVERDHVDDDEEEEEKEEEDNVTSTPKHHEGPFHWIRIIRHWGLFHIRTFGFRVKSKLCAKLFGPHSSRKVCVESYSISGSFGNAGFHWRKLQAGLSEDTVVSKCKEVAVWEWWLSENGG